MASPEQVQWVRTVTQPHAAKLLESYYTARADVDAWFATGMDSIIPNDATVMCEGDGGHPITGAMVTNFITRQSELCTDYEATNRAKLNTIILAARGLGAE